MRTTLQTTAPLLGLACLSLASSQEYSPVISCSDLKAPQVEGAVIVNITAKEINSVGVDVCDANVYLTHGNTGDHVRIQTYLPIHGYTGRFQGLGGGGMIAGFLDGNLSSSAGLGFATGATDAGRPNAQDAYDSWAGDEQLMINFGYLSVHEMTVVGKALAEQFYGQPVKYSYWSGCSNGGRQGYEEAQRYPSDYDGIMANAPGIHFDRFLVADLYPYLVEVAENEFPPTCVWEAITAAAISACDGLDGGEDNVINLPFECHFDATTTVGQTACDTTITETHARIWNNITRGPLDDQGNTAWGGLIPGSNFTSQAGAAPFQTARIWTAAFVELNKTFDINTIPHDQLYAEIAKANRIYGSVIGGDNPDLAGFRDAGGKLLTYHGLTDQVLPAYGTIDYRVRVEELLGGNEAVDGFYRLFLVPGVDHCSNLGNGAKPLDPFSLLVDWVEKDLAPDVMPGTGDVGDRDLCLYPKNLVYAGDGDLTRASSWKCV